MTRADGSTVISRIVMYDLHSLTSNTAAVQLVETEEIKISAKSGHGHGQRKGQGRGRSNSPSKDKHKHKHGHGQPVEMAHAIGSSAVSLSQQQDQLQEQEEEQERINERAQQDLQARMDRVSMSGRIERDDGETEDFPHNNNNNNPRTDLPPPPPDEGVPTGLRPPLITPLGPPVVKVQEL